MQTQKESAFGKECLILTVTVNQYHDFDSNVESFFLRPSTAMVALNKNAHIYVILHILPNTFIMQAGSKKKHLEL